MVMTTIMMTRSDMGRTNQIPKAGKVKPNPAPDNKPHPDAEWLDPLWYKVARGKVWMWGGDEWIKSTKTLEDLAAAIEYRDRERDY
jgi:hypothetical protein